MYQTSDILGFVHYHRWGPFVFPEGGRKRPCHNLACELVDATPQSLDRAHSATNDWSSFQPSQYDWAQEEILTFFPEVIEFLITPCASGYPSTANDHPDAFVA